MCLTVIGNIWHCMWPTIRRAIATRATGGKCQLLCYCVARHEKCPNYYRQTGTNSPRYTSASARGVGAYANLALISQPVRYGCLQFGMMGMASEKRDDAAAAAAATAMATGFAWRKRQTVHCLTFILLLRTN